jgi:hypothetical protein
MAVLPMIWTKVYTSQFFFLNNIDLNENIYIETKTIAVYYNKIGKDRDLNKNKTQHSREYVKML